MLLGGSHQALGWKEAALAQGCCCLARAVLLGHPCVHASADVLKDAKGMLSCTRHPQELSLGGRGLGKEVIPPDEGNVCFMLA